MGLDAMKPMLARLVRELPADGYFYEPKWDGFRCLAARDGAHVELRSRHGRPLESVLLVRAWQRGSSPHPGGVT